MCFLYLLIFTIRAAIANHQSLAILLYITTLIWLADLQRVNAE